MPSVARPPLARVVRLSPVSITIRNPGPGRSAATAADVVGLTGSAIAINPRKPCRRRSQNRRGSRPPGAVAPPPLQRRGNADAGPSLIMRAFADDDAPAPRWFRFTPLPDGCESKSGRIRPSLSPPRPARPPRSQPPADVRCRARDWRQGTATRPRSTPPRFFTADDLGLAPPSGCRSCRPRGCRPSRNAPALRRS